jgi:hypothetical protein
MTFVEVADLIDMLELDRRRAIRRVTAVASPVASVGVASSSASC